MLTYPVNMMTNNDIHSTFTVNMKNKMDNGCVKYETGNPRVVRWYTVESVKINNNGSKGVFRERLIISYLKLIERGRRNAVK